MNEPRPISPPDRATAPFWDATREHRLVIQRCGRCDHVQHYPRLHCTSCGAPDPEPFEVSGHGTIWSYTVVYRAPGLAFNAPYIVALVRLEEGPVLMTNIVACSIDEVRCDQRVIVTWEDLPDGRALPLFTPIGG